MSIAGRRDGLDGSRSSLFYEAVRIIKEMRCATDGKYPRWICWENVPVPSPQTRARTSKPSSKRSSASPSRRPRCLCLRRQDGPTPTFTWETDGALRTELLMHNTGEFPNADAASTCRRSCSRGAGKILFESEGLSGYSAEGFRSWQRAAGSFTPCVGATGFDGYNGSLTDDTSATLGVNCGISTGRNGIVLNDQGGNRMDITEEVTSTLRAEAHHRHVSWSRRASAPSILPRAAPSAIRKSVLPRSVQALFLRRWRWKTIRPTAGSKLSDDGNVQTLTSRMVQVATMCRL